MIFNRTYIVREAINHLNAVAGTNYSDTNKNTQNAIFSLMDRGYELDDFKSVIDIKWEQWKGTDYQKYVRPSTLFGKKFENYLHEPRTSKASTIQKLANSVQSVKQHRWRMD
jgi:uncharacterized phage protein (TIGR02220 family)